MSYISDITEFTTSSITYQTGDFPSSLAITYPGDRPGFGSYGFNNYRTGVGLGLPSLCFELSGVYRDGGYLMHWPYTQKMYYVGAMDFRMASLDSGGGISRTTDSINTLDGSTYSVFIDPGLDLGPPSPEPGSPWKDLQTTPIKSGDPSNNSDDPSMPDDGNGFPPTDPYPLPPLGPEVPA